MSDKYGKGQDKKVGTNKAKYGNKNGRGKGQGIQVRTKFRGDKLNKTNPNTWKSIKRQRPGETGKKKIYKGHNEFNKAK